MLKNDTRTHSVKNVHFYQKKNFVEEHTKMPPQENIPKKCFADMVGSVLKYYS